MSIFERLLGVHDNNQRLKDLNIFRLQNFNWDSFDDFSTYIFYMHSLQEQNEVFFFFGSHFGEEESEKSCFSC